MKRKLLVFLAGLFLFVANSIAQQVKVTGKVTSSEDGGPIPGVTIRVKGSSATLVQTNTDGLYSIDAKEGDVLVFTYLGMLEQEKTVRATVVNVALSSSSKGLDEVVVVGYGTQKKATLTGAISTVNVKEMLEARPTTDVVRALQGAVPGLTITSPSGALGTTPSIRLRALTGSLNGGGAQPLILLDNVEIRDLQNVNPDDIEAISVLKDASSASIYGTRAAWGVVLITTKSGKKNTPTQVNYSNNVAWATPTQTLQMAPGAEGAEMALTAYRRTNPALVRYGAVGMYVDDIAVQKMREWRELYGGQDLGPEMVLGRDFEIRDGFFFPYREWDPGKEYMKKWTPQQKHDISVTGGTEKTTFNLGAGLLNQSGILKVNPDEFTRHNMTLNVTTDVNKWFTARGRVMYSNTTTSEPFSFGGTTYDPMYYLYRWPAQYPMGTYNGQPFRNAVSELEQSKMINMKNSVARLSLGGTVKIIDGLTLDADYTYTGTNYNRHEVGGSAAGIDFWSTGAALTYRTYTTDAYNRVVYNSAWDYANYGRAVLNYNKNIGKHSFQFKLGGEAEKFEAVSQRSERRNMIDPDKGELPLTTGDQFASGAHSHWATIGVFGRINYTFNDRYIFEATGRYDGSSRFPANDRTAFFPSLSAGYIISEENFMNFAKPVLSTLKFKAAWGQIGHQNVGNAFLSLMSASTSGWLVGNINQIGVSTPTLVPPTLTWETVTDLNLGIESRFFDNKLGVNLDWYKRKTSDMISAGVALPSSFGATAPRRNFGELEAKGFELAVDFNHKIGRDFKFNITAVLSDFQERITKFAGSRLLTGNYEGKTIGEIWGYETDRLFTGDDFQRDAAGNFVLAGGKYVLKPGIAPQTQFETSAFWFGPGDVKYRDLNGDGVVNQGDNTVENPGDKRVIGNTTPRYQYSFRLGGSWREFDFGIFFQGVGKRELWVHSPATVPGVSIGEGWYENQLDYWTPENPNAFYPRPSNVGQTADVTNFKVQTRYLLNLAYLRAKNISVGYTFPKKLTDRIKMNRARVYFSGENLFEKDNLEGLSIDPEVDFTTTGANDARSFGRVYPYRRTISFGLQVTL